MPEIQRTGDGLPGNFSWVLKDTLGKIQIKLTLNYYMICFTSPAGCAAPASEEELQALGNHTQEVELCLNTSLQRGWASLS